MFARCSLLAMGYYTPWLPHLDHHAFIHYRCCLSFSAAPPESGKDLSPVRSGRVFCVLIETYLIHFSSLLQLASGTVSGD